MRNVYIITAFVVCFVGLYAAVFIPTVAKFKTSPVKQSEYCKGNYFAQCTLTYFYDLPTFCIIQTDNSSFAVVNSTHAQLGNRVFAPKGRLVAVNFTGTILNSRSVLSEQQTCQTS